MTDRTGLTSKTARLIHISLVAGVVVYALVFAVMRSTLAFDLNPAAATALRYGALGLLAASGVLIGVLRRGVPEPGGDDVDAWWGAHGTRVVPLWALAEATALTGAIVWMMTGDPVVLIVVYPFALILLYRLRPSVWTGG